MTLAGVVLVVIVAAVVVAASLAALSARPGPARGRRPGTARAGRVLRLFAVVVTVVVAAVVVGPAWRDSGTFALVLVGVPVAAAVVVLALDVAGRPTTSATWAAAAVVLTWSLLTGLGLGLHFLGPSVLMLLAAVVSTGDRRTRGAGPAPRAGGGPGRALT